MPKNTDQLNAKQKRSFWKHHLEKWQESGLSQQAYCHEHNLKTHQFYYWRRQFNKEDGVAFLPVTFPADSILHSFAVRIVMPNGCSIELEGRDAPEQLERLVTIVSAL